MSEVVIEGHGAGRRATALAERWMVISVKPGVSRFNLFGIHLAGRHCERAVTYRTGASQLRAGPPRLDARLWMD